MFDTIKAGKAAATSLLICGMLIGGAAILGVQTFLGTGNQIVRADERGDEEHWWERYKEHHPNAFNAIHALYTAEDELLKAKEYHGHRDAAVKLVRDARHELRAGIEADEARH